MLRLVDVEVEALLVVAFLFDDVCDVYLDELPDVEAARLVLTGRV